MTITSKRTLEAFGLITILCLLCIDAAYAENANQTIESQYTILLDSPVISNDSSTDNERTCIADTKFHLVHLDKTIKVDLNI